MTMSLFALLAFCILRLFLSGLTPLLRRRPWVVPGRSESAVLTTLLVIGAAIDVVRLLQAAEAGAVPAGMASGAFGPLFIGIGLAVGFALHGTSFIGVREDAFRKALVEALDSEGYEYELRVDPSGRPSRVVFGGQSEGIEIVARSRFGGGKLRGKGPDGRALERDVAARLREVFSKGAAKPHLPSRLTAIATACVLAGVCVAVFT